MKYNRNVIAKPIIFRNSTNTYKSKPKKINNKRCSKYFIFFYLLIFLIVLLAIYNVYIHNISSSIDLLTYLKINNVNLYERKSVSDSIINQNIQNQIDNSIDIQLSKNNYIDKEVDNSINEMKIPIIEKPKFIPNISYSNLSRKPRKPLTTKKKTNLKDYIHEDDPKYDENEKYKDEKYVKVIQGKKTGVRQDRRVVFPESDFTFKDKVRPIGEPSGILGQPRGLIIAENILKTHPLYLINNQLSLEETMVFIQNYQTCVDKPIFLTMATVGDDLYWQLIENFVYTMVKFNVSDCSLVICVSDPNCMKLCSDNIFPCYNYEYEYYPMPSVMEQIAGVKLYHIPKALSLGVNVFMLDLDVGFLDDPMHMVKVFMATPSVDIFVQEDMLFVMNRSRAGWKTWNTEALPNIGLFLCRGNYRTRRMFDLAWDKYQDMTDDDSKRQPGKDQNHVLEAMRFGRVKFGLRYAYFSNYTAVLLDKFNLLQSRTIELGGEVSADLLQSQRAIAMHTTCYEQSTKVMGLKATNAFWNPKYYDPLRPTITKQLLYISEEQLLDEVRSLIWLGIRTNRSVIIPNILGNDDMDTVPSFKSNILWPGFRVTKLKRFNGKSVLKIDILEPGFYWRVQRDYDIIPTPSIIWYNNDNLEVIRQNIINNYMNEPRIVLYSTLNVISDQLEHNKIIAEWADSSYSQYHTSFRELRKSYQGLPSVKSIRDEFMANECLQGMRNCMNIFGPLRGNRTCFQICD